MHNGEVAIGELADLLPWVEDGARLERHQLPQSGCPERRKPFGRNPGKAVVVNSGTILTLDIWSILCVRLPSTCASSALALDDCPLWRNELVPMASGGCCHEGKSLNQIRSRTGLQASAVAPTVNLSVLRRANSWVCHRQLSKPEDRQAVT